MSYAARLRQIYPYRAPSTAVDHLVVGGGVLGLAVAAGLVNTAGRGRTTFLVERRPELSPANSRKSGVIQSGIYYPPGSLKSQLCIRGRELLSARCAALGIDHRKTQKLVVATSNSQIPYLDHLQGLSLDSRLRQGTGALSSTENDSSIPAYFLSGDDARDMEPDLSPSVNGAVILTETGILDRQGLLQSLEKEVEEEEYLSSVTQTRVGVGRRRSGKGDNRGEGVIMRGTRVVRIDPDEKSGWVVQLESGWTEDGGAKGEVEAVRAEVVVNAAGWDGVGLTDEMIPESERSVQGSVRSLYMSYDGPGVENISRIIHPCPDRGTDGTSARLTVGVDGKIHFGPALKFLDPRDTSLPSEPSLDENQLASIGQAIQNYLPNVDLSLLRPDFVTSRPYLSTPGDCMIRHTEERRGLVELIGFDDPLTSALAVGEAVADKVKREVWRGGRAVDELAKGWE